MPFHLKDLSVLAYANGFTLWHYRSDDAATTVDTANYFAAAADLLRVGDMILANTDAGSSGGMFRVRQNDAAAVDVTNLAAALSGNTD